MQLHRLRQFALSLPHASVVKQWGETLVFKVGGKMFLTVSLDGEIVEALSFKCSPPDFRRLTGVDGIVPAPYLARASWVQLEDVLALPWSGLEAQIRQSYELVWERLPKKIQAALAAGEPKP